MARCFLLRQMTLLLRLAIADRTIDQDIWRLGHLKPRPFTFHFACSLILPALFLR